MRIAYLVLKPSKLLMKHSQKTLLLIVMVASAIVFPWQALAAPPLPGAIFTTTENGDIVNENVRYNEKEDVYLDGGPGPNAPSTAAGLPEGDYYFQVTDPSGKDLLSPDHISCRKIHVNDCGVIDIVFSGMTYEWVNGKDGGWVEVPCQHGEGTDQDWGGDPCWAITVQLFPYDDTPNPGGVYKAWITPVDDYTGDPNLEPINKNDQVNGENYKPGNVHGFIPSKSKTDNYKVKKRGKPCPPPEISLRKFHDKDVDTTWDGGEEEVIGWEVFVTSPPPNSVTNSEFTPQTLVAEPAGEWIFEEGTPDGTLQTVSKLEGAPVTEYPFAVPTVVVDVAGDCDETHEVIYGNVGLGKITACKVFDRNGNGEVDGGEPGIPGWRIEVTGVDVRGVSYGPVTQATGADGCTTFTDLLPGTYTVTELVPNTTVEWVSTGPTSFEVTIESSLDGSVMIGTNETVTFTNFCEGTADFDTKGYWHNKNGLGELAQQVIDDVNELVPYKTPSTYFDNGDEPFDGQYEDGTPVASVHGSWGELIAGDGTPKAEVSHFLVDSNATGDPREQLAQQLLAFYLNVIYRLQDPDATIPGPYGTWVSASELINGAIDAWSSGTAAEQTSLKNWIDALNNNDSVPFIPFNPCPVHY